MADFDVRVDLAAHKRIIDRINQLPPKLQTKGAVRAARKAMRVVRDDARARARQLDDESTPEQIWKNIVIQQSTRRSKAIGGVYMRVGVKGGARNYANTKRNVREGKAGKKYNTLGDKTNPGGDTWYWRFLELGTEHSAARPFLLPALMNQAQGVSNELAAEMTKELDEAVR